MAFLPPSTFPLYLRFYEHGHAVTFIRQRLMSRSAVKYYLTIRPLFFPPFSPLLPSPNERRLRLCFPDQDNRNRIEHGSYLAALYRLRSSNFFFFFFFVSVSATEKIISASTSTRRIPPYWSQGFKLGIEYQFWDFESFFCIIFLNKRKSMEFNVSSRVDNRDLLSQLVQPRDGSGGKNRRVAGEKNGRGERYL